MLLFAVRESVQASLGFSSFELVFGSQVRRPLKILKEHWLAEDDLSNLLDHVSGMRYQMTKVSEMAKAKLTRQP